MRWFLRGYGGEPTPPENIKREGWRAEGILVVSEADPRLTWPERELVRQLGAKLYGGRSMKEARDG